MDHVASDGREAAWEKYGSSAPSILEVGDLLFPTYPDKSLAAVTDEGAKDVAGAASLLILITQQRRTASERGQLCPTPQDHRVKLSKPPTFTLNCLELDFGSSRVSSRNTCNYFETVLWNWIQEDPVRRSECYKLGGVGSGPAIDAGVGAGARRGFRAQ